MCHLFGPLQTAEIIRVQKHSVPETSLARFRIFTVCIRSRAGKKTHREARICKNPQDIFSVPFPVFIGLLTRDGARVWPRRISPRCKTKLHATNGKRFLFCLP